MKVLLLNGSPHHNGCTYTALQEVGKELNKHDISTEVFQIGTRAVQGCIACGKCRELGNGCIFKDELLISLIAKIKEVDGIVIGSPVYYAGPNGSLCALLDRLFCSSSKLLKHKCGCAIVNCRRGGASASFDRLNKYLTINQMPVVSSQYWNATHGNNVEELLQDLEGLQIMRTLGKNMAYMMHSLANGDINLPELEQPIHTNYIR